jgi:hypothetical protein
MKRLVLTLMVAAATMLGVSALAPAGIAGAYPPARPPVINVNVPSVGPGGNFTVTIGNCEAGERVVIRFQGQARIVICNPSTLQASLALGAPMAPGTYEVCGDLTGTGATMPAGVTRPQTVCTSVSVLAAATTVPATIPGGGLPATGSSGLGTTTTSAIVVLGAGALLLVVSQVRRRRTTAPTVG